MSELEGILNAMKRDAMGADDCSFELPSKYASVIRDAGNVEFLTRLFISTQSLALLNIINGQIRKIWHQVSAVEYVEIERAISSHYGAIYGFVIFSGNVLNVDACTLFHSDPIANEVAKDYVKRNFKNGPPSGDCEIAKDVLGSRFNSVWNNLSNVMSVLDSELE